MNSERNFLKVTALVAVLILGLATAAVAQTCPEPTPAEELAATIELIGTLDLNAGNANALMQPLSSALISVATGAIDAAIRQLATFENKVEAQSGKALSTEDADLLLAMAAQIVASLTGPQPDPCPCPSAFPEYGTFFADFTSAHYCQFNDSTGSVYLAIAEGDTGRSVGAIPGDAVYPARCYFSSPETYLTLSITGEEFLGCQQLLLDTAAAAGVTCEPPPPAP